MHSPLLRSICSSDVINYMVPLSRQTDFFVPEMKEEVKTDAKEEDSDEDRGTDITGNVYFVYNLVSHCRTYRHSAKEKVPHIVILFIRGGRSSD